MPEPLRGIVEVAEYGTRFDAEVAVAKLADRGIGSTILGDPAATVAPHHVTQPGYRILVLRPDAESASEVLGSGASAETAALEAAFHHRRFQDRPRWIKVMTLLLIVAIPLPLAIASAVMTISLVARLFP